MIKKFTIGEFSEITGISKRMLRHYDKLNLFCPSDVNEDNGYRLYSQDQIALLEKIQFLRTLGFSLVDIREIMSSPINLNDFLEILKDKEINLSKDEDEIKSSLLATRRMINLLEGHASKLFPSVSKLLDWERSLTVTNQKISSPLVDLKSFMNRDYFVEKIEEILNSDQGDHYHFITFDIDRFMRVNDEDGYEVGDKVILYTISLIYHQMKDLLEDNKGDQLTCRLGGDEFSVFLKNKNHDLVIKHVENALEAVRNFDYKDIGSSQEITASCGVACGEKPDHVETLKHLSGKALMEAKRKGRNGYFLIEY
jgi:diguanylate cyclase (GGDEF)-like protein